MDFKESLKKLRSMSDEEVVTMVEKATGKALVSYEGIDALIAALMGFYNGELKKKSPTGHKHAKEDITNFPSSMPPTAHTHDDRYYTEGEINNKLSTKVNTSDIVDNLTDNSQNKALSARQGKILNDNKSDKADEWRINARELINLDVTFDLNDYREAGVYRCPRDIQKWKNLPPGFPNGAFNLVILKISQAYTTQMIFSYYKPQYYIRNFYDGIIGPWQQIAMLNPDGNFEIGATRIIAGSYNYGFTCKNQNGTNIYSLLIADKDKRLHLGYDNAVPITLDASDVKIQNSTVWHSGNFNPDSKLNTSGGTISGALTVNGNIATGGNITGNSSHTISGFGKIYNAVWNDYAEFFERGEETEAGDIIALDESQENEIYVKATKGSKVIAGIHSDSFAHLIGGEQPPNGEDFVEYNLKKYIPVGLAGRVRCKVRGVIKRGDKIILSDTAGVGEALKELNVSNINIVGIALENKKTEDIGAIKILIK